MATFSVSSAHGIGEEPEPRAALRPAAEATAGPVPPDLTVRFQAADPATTAPAPPPPTWDFPAIPGAHEPFGADSRWCRACTAYFEVGVLFPCLTAQGLAEADEEAAR
jgi:hypothetical protein